MCVWIAVFVADCDDRRTEHVLLQISCLGTVWKVGFKTKWEMAVLWLLHGCFVHPIFKLIGVNLKKESGLSRCFETMLAKQFLLNRCLKSLATNSDACLLRGKFHWIPWDSRLYKQALGYRRYDNSLERFVLLVSFFFAKIAVLFLFFRGFVW